MSLRDEMIQHLYEKMSNEELDYGLGDDLFDSVGKRVGVISGKRYEDMMGALLDLEHAAFFAGANMVMDFISGKDV